MKTQATLKPGLKTHIRPDPRIIKIVAACAPTLQNKTKLIINILARPFSNNNFREMVLTVL